jgi:hypothetical protein
MYCSTPSAHNPPIQASKTTAALQHSVLQAQATSPNQARTPLLNNATHLFFSSLFSRDGWGFWPLGPAAGDDDVEAVAEADEEAMMRAIEGKEADYTTDGVAGPLESVEGGESSGTCDRPR